MDFFTQHQTQRILNIDCGKSVQYTLHNMLSLVCFNAVSITNRTHLPSGSSEVAFGGQIVNDFESKRKAHKQ